MYRLLFACILLSAAAFGLARAAEPTPAGFTQEIAAGIRRAMPSSTVTVVRELELAIKHADGTAANLSLANGFHDYARDPKLLPELVARYVTALTKPSSTAAAAKFDRGRIVPVIKTKEWLAVNRRALQERGVQQDFLTEDFNKELIVAFAEDSGSRTRYLMASEDVGDRKALRALAVANLRRLLPKVEMRAAQDGFFLISAGGDYEASLLLLDDIWSAGQIKVDGDIVVGVPAKDVLLVTGSRNRKGLKAVRELVAKFVAQQRYAVSDALFVYREGQFTRFGHK